MGCSSLCRHCHHRDCACWPHLPHPVSISSCISICSRPHTICTCVSISCRTCIREAKPDRNSCFPITIVIQAERPVARSPVQAAYRTCTPFWDAMSESLSVISTVPRISSLMITSMWSRSLRLPSLMQSLRNVTARGRTRFQRY